MISPKKPLRLAALSAACLVLLNGCATRTPADENDQPFINHWKNESTTRQGFSPAVEDLNPEPRVLMKQTARSAAGQDRPLPRVPVTLRLQNANVDTVLRSMASAADVSIMLGEGITGKVSLNVRNARWADVFTSILRSNGLDYRWQGKILQVMTAAEKQREVSMLKLNNQLTEQFQTASHTGDTSIQVVNVRYSDAASLKASLSKFVARNKDAVIEIDEHNNALVLQGTPMELSRMVALIDHLDRPRPQVQLKAYIVETTKEKARELGMQWGGRFSAGNTGSNQLIGGSGGSNLDGSGKDTITGLPMGLNYGDIVNMTGSSNIGMAFGRLGGNVLEAQLSMMERDGVLNILSSPSITTLDNKMAYTENGEKVPYVSKDDDGDQDVKFEDAVLRLEMTPNVIDSANLKLKVLIKKDEVDGSRSVEGNPYIIKKQTETTVLVRTGETIVISGLTKEKGTNAEAGVPGARDLPGGKYAFGATNRSVTMEEVLIFITPTILPTRTAADRDQRPLAQSPGTLDTAETMKKKAEAEARAKAEAEARAAAEAAAQTKPVEGEAVLQLQ